MGFDLYHARTLLDKLEEHKLKIPHFMYEEFTRLVELACQVATAEEDELPEKVGELYEFLS